MNNTWDDLDASSFYRIITPLAVQEGKLKLPKNFVKEYGDELSTKIRVNVPSGGDIWDIGIERADENMIWLQDGCRRFAEHYFIQCGHFLLFKYKGNSEFDVWIFDLSANEIEYPCSTESKKKSLSHVDQVTGQGKFFHGFSIDHQLIEISDSSDNEEDEFAGETPDFDRVCSKIKKSRRRRRRRTGASKEDKMHDLPVVARVFKSDNPYFSRTMKPYNLTKNFVVHVPAGFSRAIYSACHVGDSIDLQDSDGNKWSVRTVMRNGKLRCLSKGWSDFAKKKKLCLGDVCIFELIVSPCMLKVSIFRAKEVKN